MKFIFDDINLDRSFNFITELVINFISIDSATFSTKKKKKLLIEYPLCD